MLRDDETGRGYSSICQREEITHDDFLGLRETTFDAGGQAHSRPLGTASRFPLSGIVCRVSTPTSEQIKPARTKHAGIKKRQTDRGVDRLEI